MKLSRAQDAVLVLLAIASMIPVALAELTSELALRSQSYLFLAAAILAGAIGVAVAGDRSRLPYRSVIVRVAVLVSVVYTLIEVFQMGQVPVIALGHFCMGLCIAKFLDLNVARDRGVVVVISMLLMVIGAMVSANVAFAAVLVLHVIVGVRWLARFRLAAEFGEVTQRTAQALARTGRRIPVAAMPAQTLPRVSLISLAHGGVLAIIVVLTFLTIPRNLFSAQFQLSMPPSMSGFTSHVGLDDMAPLLESDQPVMRVRIRVDGAPLENADEQPYLRGLTFDRYQHGRWLPTPRGSPRSIRLADAAGPQPLSKSIWPPPRSGLVDQDVWLDRVEDAFLFTIYPALAISSPDLPQVDFQPSDRVVKALRAPTGKVYYRVTSARRPDPNLVDKLAAEAREAMQPPPVVETVLRKLASRRVGPISRIPPREPAGSTITLRVADLAREVTRTTVTPVEPVRVADAARAIEQFLLSRRFTYSLDPRSARRPGDLIENFLFESHRGYCEHFASAMTVMCQSLGIEARLVAGFHGGEYNAVGDFFRIRKKDAHAWVEVSVPNVGWVTFDPTPPDNSRNHGDRSGMAAALSRWYDYFQFSWASFVVSFDAQHRRELFAAFGKWWQQLKLRGSGSEGWLDRVLQFLYGPTFFNAHQRIMYWAAMVLVVALAALVLRAAWVVSLLVREHLPRPRRDRVMRPRRARAGFYDRLLILLSRLGHRKPGELTPREFARELAARYRHLAPVIDLTEWFYQVQFGQRDLSRETHSAIGQMLVNLREYGTFDPDTARAADDPGR